MPTDARNLNSQIAQNVVEQMAVERIKAAIAQNLTVVLIGTETSRPLAAAAGLPWLHELPEKDPVPQWVAWDPAIAEAGGPLLPPPVSDDRLVILGPGMSEFVSRRSPRWAQFISTGKEKRCKLARREIRRRLRQQGQG